MSPTPAPTPLSVEQRALVRAHVPLARRIARAMARRRAPHLRDDLCSAAFEALTQAALRFDPSRSVPFEAYAYRRITGHLLNELGASHSRFRSFVEAALDALPEHMPSPGDDDARINLESQAADITFAMVLRLGLEAHGTGGEDDMIANQASSALRHALSEALTRLGRREQRLIELRYEESLPWPDIAHELQVSLATVKRMDLRLRRRLGLELQARSEPKLRSRERNERSTEA